MRAAQKAGSDHDTIIRLASQFDSHTEECAERYKDAKSAMQDMRSSIDTGIAEIKAMVSGFSTAATNNADQINIRVNGLSTRVLLAVISTGGVIIVGLLVVLGTILMYGRPWDHLNSGNNARAMIMSPPNMGHGPHGENDE